MSRSHTHTIDLLLTEEEEKANWRVITSARCAYHGNTQLWFYVLFVLCIHYHCIKITTSSELDTVFAVSWTIFIRTHFWWRLKTLYIVFFLALVKYDLLTEQIDVVCVCALWVYTLSLFLSHTHTPSCSVHNFHTYRKYCNYTVSNT